ncbi:Solute carrier family 52, riboflavin transporter, member 3-A isoform X4 [Oopsacas minuta]|uniref:Riboflavin transporter n=1 Tax=Oopsacas minuta TaxID=111878 RepID=A0AAV7KEX8_9METZ|nr:Solute carrier family 52, riboflavin transporter, member 3-A isoform X4 [Oopsacas minuta]
MDFDASLLRAQITGNDTKLKYLRSRFREVSITTYLLFILLGLASWFAMNGVLLESPVLSAYLPECNQLKSYVAVIIQFANIGPVTFLGVKGCMRLAGKRTNRLDTIAIYCVLCLSLISCILITLFWGKQMRFFEKNVSLSFFFLTACIALANNTNTVLLVPYFSSFPGFYLSALYVGEALSGLIPSLWASIQGMPSSLNCSYAGDVAGISFNPGIYFMMLVFCSFLSLLGFSLLHILPAPRKEKNKLEVHRMSNLDLAKAQSRHFTYRPSKKMRKTGWYLFNNSNSNDWHTSSIESCESNHHHLESLNDQTPAVDSQNNKLIWLAIFIVLIFLISAFSNSILFEFLPYYTMRYSTATYYWTLNLYFVSMAISSLCSGIFHPKHRSLYPVLTSVYLAIAIWFIFLSANSHILPMKNTPFGGLHVVVLSMIAGGIVGYLKVGVTINARSMGGEFYLLLVGIIFQLGALVGSLIAFVTIDWSGALSL